MRPTTFAKIICFLSDEFYIRSPLLAFRIFQNNSVHYFEFSIIDRRANPNNLFYKNRGFLMRSTYLSFVSIFLILLISGCYIVEPDEPFNDVLHPLAVGNWWEYEILRPQWSNPNQGTVRETVTEKLEADINGIVYPVWGWNAEIDSEDFPQYKWLARNGDEGLYLMGGIAETDTFFMNELQYKYPAEVGESWEVPQLSFSRTDYRFYSSDTLSITLIDINRRVETPAGNFSCYVYNFQVSMGDDVAESFDYYLFYSPGIGLVIQEERGSRDQRILSKLLLIDYNIVK